MSKREALVIFLLAIAIALALPFAVTLFLPRQAGPENLPGVPFSTTQTQCRPANNPPADLKKELGPNVVRGRVTVWESSTPLAAEINWRIVRTSLGEVIPAEVATVNADDQGRFTITIPPIKEGSRFLLHVEAKYRDFRPANSLDRWMDVGEEQDLGLIQMRPFSRVSFVWKGRQVLDLGGEFLGLARVEANPKKTSDGFSVRFDATNVATCILEYGRWDVWLVLYPERRLTKTLLPYIHRFEINSPAQEFEIVDVCSAGGATLSANVTDLLGAQLDASITVSRLGPGNGPGNVGIAIGALTESNLPSGIYQVDATWNQQKQSRRVYLAENGHESATLVMTVRAHLDLQILRKGKPVEGANVILGWQRSGVTTDKAGKASFTYESTDTTVSITLKGVEGRQNIIVTRLLLGWGDRASRVIELEPEGSVSLTVDARFQAEGKDDTRWSQRLHVKCLEPLAYADEYRWADSTRGFRFIGLPRGKYLIELTEFSGRTDAQRQFGPWTQMVDLTDRTQNAFTVAPTIATHSFDCSAKVSDPAVTPPYMCSFFYVTDPGSDSHFSFHERSLEVDKTGTIKVRDLPAGNWRIRTLFGTDKNYVELYGSLSFTDSEHPSEVALNKQSPANAEPGRSVLQVELSFTTPTNKPACDGLLTLRNQAGIPLGMWLTGPKTGFCFFGLPAGAYWISYVSPYHAWDSTPVSFDCSGSARVQHISSTHGRGLFLRLQNTDLTATSGAYLETEEGCQPKCTFRTSSDGVVLEADYVPFSRTVYLCLGDGRRIAFQFESSPIEYRWTELTLDLRKRWQPWPSTDSR